MRELSATLKAGQQAGALNPLYKIEFTKGASSYTYGQDRILPSEHDEELYSHRAKIVLNNRDAEFNDKDLKGYDAVISYGVIGKAGEEYLATASLSIIDQQFDSDPNKLTCTLELEGMPNLMGEDEASEPYMPDEDDTKTVKTLVNAIVGATLDPFTHCKAFEVVWDDGYDTLADNYKPKDSFRVYTSGSRLAALRRVLDFTANVPRFEADGKVHILRPVTSGESFDYEYNLESGHTFFSKAYRNSLVFPNRVVVKSRDDDDPQYSGSAQITGYDSLPDKVKKTKFVQVRLESNDQAEDIAEALIAKAEMGAARGQAEIRINVGAEAFDYVKVVDQRQGDTRTGNLGYIHRRFGKDKWLMTFGFGNWLDMLRYQKILKELETYTDAGQYFSRLSVGHLYAENLLAKNMGFYWIDPDNTIDLSKVGTLDDLPDGEQYLRVSTWNLSLDEDPESPTYGLFILKMDEHVAYQPGYNPSEKRRTFTTTPTTPYDIGDLWLDADTVKRCITARATGAYQASDWMATTLDAIENGEVFSRVRSMALSPAGLVFLDQVEEGTFGLVYSMDLSAHHLLLSKTVKDGLWYEETGVVIDATYGIALYGGEGINAFRTFASKEDYESDAGKSGEATATTANHLIDATNAQFEAGDVGKIVYNYTDGTTANVTQYNSASDLTLDADIMADGESYYLYGTAHAQVYIGTDGKLYAGEGAVILDANGVSVGAGKVIMDSDGITIEGESALASKFKFKYSGGDIGFITAWHSVIQPSLYGLILASYADKCIYLGPGDHQVLPFSALEKLGSTTQPFYGGYFGSRLKIPVGVDCYD